MIGATSFSETLRAVVETAMPGVVVRHHVDGSDLNPGGPHVVVTVTAEQERVPGNHTWELEVAVELHANAYATKGEEHRRQFQTLCAILSNPQLAKELNEVAEDFYLYRLALQGIDEPQVHDNSFIQTAHFRALVQF